MSSIGENLRAFLLADTAIVAKVGDRIHEEHVPQQTIDWQGKPNDAAFILLSKQSAMRELLLDSQHGEEEDGWVFDADCYAATIGKAKLLADTLAARLQGYVGQLGRMAVKLIAIEDQPGDYEPRGNGSDSGLFRYSYQVEVYR